MELLELVRLSRLAGDYAGTLSGGQRKLLEFGRALMTAPRMVLLDEPMAGVAPALAMQLLEHILELRATRGTTILVIEHDMEAVMAISDRVIVMDEGRVIADGPAGGDPARRAGDRSLSRTQPARWRRRGSDAAMNGRTGPHRARPRQPATSTKTCCTASRSTCRAARSSR